MKENCKHRVDALEYFNNRVGKCLDCGAILTSYYPLSEEDLKLIDEMDKKYKTGPYSPFFKKYRTEILSWLITIGGVSGVSAFIYAMSVYKILLEIFLGILVVALGLILLYAFKMLVKMFVFNELE